MENYENNSLYNSLLTKSVGLIIVGENLKALESIEKGLKVFKSSDAFLFLKNYIKDKSALLPNKLTEYEVGVLKLLSSDSEKEVPTNYDEFLFYEEKQVIKPKRKILTFAPLIVYSIIYISCFLISLLFKKEVLSFAFVFLLIVPVTLLSLSIAKLITKKYYLYLAVFISLILIFIVPYLRFIKIYDYLTFLKKTLGAFWDLLIYWIEGLDLK